MRKEPNPYKTATMSTRILDMEDPRHAKVRKTLDSTEADRRQALRPGTIKLEDQAIGMSLIEQITKHRFENPRDSQFIGTHLGYAALFAGLYTSATHTSEVMNRVIDIPEVADGEWRQTTNGLWVQTENTASAATKGAQELTIRHINHMDAAYRTRRIGRTFGSLAASLFNLGQPIPSGTPFEVQHAIRERVMDSGFAARQQVSEIGQFPSVSALRDLDSPQSAWLRRNAPSQEVYSVITQAQEELRSAA